MMWIREPRKVSEEIEYLGATEMCIYLLKGRGYIPKDIFFRVIRSIVDNIIDGNISGQDWVENHLTFVESREKIKDILVRPVPVMGVGYGG